MSLIRELMDYEFDSFNIRPLMRSAMFCAIMSKSIIIIIIIAGDQVVCDSMRSIMAARAINDIFHTTDYNLLVTDDALKYVGLSIKTYTIACWLRLG